MAAIIISESVQAYFPHSIDPSQIWVNYNPLVDSLTIYFTGSPTPSIWEDVDEYAYIGFDAVNETIVTGLMIEHFSRWLLLPGRSAQEMQVV